MPVIESRSPVYSDNHANHSRGQNESVADYLSSSPSGNNFLSSNQSGFPFSAEPAMIDYTGMSSLAPSNDPTMEAAFTPQGSSYDSLHPDILNQTYSQQNVFLQSSGTLSTGTSVGQSLSPPAHSMNDHVSPEGYLSDSMCHDYSQYTTPSFGEQLLEDQLETFLNIDGNGTASPFDEPYNNGSSISLGANTGSIPAFTHTQASISSTNPSDSQLLSPSLTNQSSPVMGIDNSQNLNVTGIRFAANDFPPPSSPSPTGSSGGARSTPSKQQHSPALTNSPGEKSLANQQPRMPHFTSPIVMVENCSRGESPARSDLSGTLSKRSYGSRRSGTHLSPFPVDDSSEDGIEQEPPPNAKPVCPPTERNEDGSWLADNISGQAGINPGAREAMKEIYVPTLEEQAEQRLVAEKNAEVEDWLTRSEVGSEAGDGASPAPAVRKKRSANRQRAKSQNDASVRQTLGSSLGLGVQTVFDDSGIPGPGVYIDERSELDEEEVEEVEEVEDQKPESPPANVQINTNDKDMSYFPRLSESDVQPQSSVVTRLWNDIPFEPEASSNRYQPATSNAAMMRFHQRAKDIEAASLAATIGSRRMSESDLGSLHAAAGISKLVDNDANKGKSKEKRERRPSFFDSILPKRTNSNLLKRKGSHPTPQQQTPDAGQTQQKEPPLPLEKPKRMGSWGRPKSPRLDTNVSNHSKDVGPGSAANLSASSGPWAHAKNAIRRSRSRSDLGKSPGLAELMTQHGGPPMLTLASPLADTGATRHSSPLPSPGNDDDNDEDMSQEAVIMDLKVRSDPIIPTYEGFKTHARQLNPRLVDYMVERITQEQMRRYKRLLEFKVKHLNAVTNRNCASTEFCTALGGGSKQLPPRAGNKDSDAPFIGFQITAPGSSDDDAEAATEGTVVSAQFPQGVPLPPVKRLPAEFECPLCFKVKKFYKPSDWTKHVHEDVQPFTCTFPNCGEPKSFKRKADWVRHENERHRQLENWTCSMADCNHTCYRKDNFVQHLVREHKIAEPRARAGRSGNGGTKDSSAHPDNAQGWQGGFPGVNQTSKDTSDDVWVLVEKCRQDTTKQPKDEPCRFCGNILTSWKKLTVHLAKHMEQISMPILPLVEQKQINTDTIISPVVEMPEQARNQINALSKSPNDNPSRYNPSSAVSSLASPFEQTYSQYSSDISPSGLTAPAMHTYPPPQHLIYRPQQPVQASPFTFPVDTTSTYANRSYPGFLDTKQRSPYVNGVQIPSQSYRNSNVQNGSSRYAPPITPVSTYGQPVFSSPVDTTPFSTDSLPSTYLPQDPQSSSTTQAGMSGSSQMAYDQGTGAQYQQSSYQQIPLYMQQQQQQQSYPYRGQ